MMDEMRILATLVSGPDVPQEYIERGIEMGAEVISAQGTTLDQGAYLLGTSSLYPRGGKAVIRRNVERLITAAARAHIPIICSAGASGHDPGLEGVLQIIDEVASGTNLRLRLAILHAEIDKDYLIDKLSRVPVRRLVDHPSLEELLQADTVEKCTHIVGQMGPEPFLWALSEGVDGVISGRALDEAPYWALPLHRGFDRGLVGHMGKLVEVPLAAGVSKGHVPILATLRRDYLLLQPAAEGEACTATSVAQVALYERAHPTLMHYPGGILDLSDARYEQYDDVSVKASGGRWTDTPYQVKLEGAVPAGHRSLGIAGVRDPIALQHINRIFSDARRTVERIYPDLEQGRDYRMQFRVYGLNGVMGEQEPVKQSHSHELGVIIEVVAEDPDLSRGICHDALHRMSMTDFPGRRTTAGNIAFGMSPDVIEAGQAYEFAIHHLLPVDDPLEPFRLEIVDFPRASRVSS